MRNAARTMVIASLLSLTAAAAQAGALTAADLETAAALRDAALAGTQAYDIVASLTTEVGPRQAGTAGDKAAVAWAQRKLAEAGLQGVRLQTVMVPHWERGEIEARAVAPFPQPMVATALGGSIGTAEAGLEAEIVAFGTLEDLKAATRQQVEGRIVYLGQRARRDATWAGYRDAVSKRVQGPGIAAGLGARALLIRSVGTSSARVAHTGTLSYGIDAPKIPAAALSNPDADLLERMLAGGEPVRFFLRVTARDLPYEPSANVMAELPGSDLKEEIVLVGAHLDSWDLGTGAIDDGAGVAVAIEVAAMMKRLGIKPRRTVRVVLFASEEYTLAGGKEYARLPDEELERHVLLMEADAGAGRVVALQSRVPEDRLPLVAQVAAVLAPLGAVQGDNNAPGGADISATMARGIPALTLQQDVSDYLDAHHSPNDNLDKVDRRTLDQVVAAYLPAVYLAAQAEGAFGRNAPRAPGGP
jgi:carboxypeptidase Q